MGQRTPFILLDDARREGGAAAHLFENPRQIFVATRGDEVASVLQDADNARGSSGGTLAGYIAYEAGLALEPKLAPLVDTRGGAVEPLVWLGLFEDEQEIAAEEVPQWLASRSKGTGSLGPLEPQLSTGGYIEAFARLQEAIHAGDIYQVNLTYRLAGAYRGDPVALYSQLRPAAEAGYGGLIFDGSHWLLSLSPELFVSFKGGTAKVKPMKGTRPRGATAEADQALADELASSVKDKAENLMIVDLMRNDLSRVAEAGSVRVEAPFTVESYPTVHQMVSSVHAKLQSGKAAIDLIRAIFPCGSITGAPKIRAMELINEVERDARGPYCGAIGRISANGDAAFNVAIRTLRLTPEENNRGRAVMGVGSAIVADSDAMAERRECEIKAGFARRLSDCDLIETMLFDPESGIDLLELHLERIKASAQELGFSFDRHAARNQIQALCFDLEQRSRVRLLASRRGELALETGPVPDAKDDPLKCIALPIPVDPGDWRLRHKTTDRGFYEEALAAAKAEGAEEALLVCPEGFVTEGSFTNIFVERDGVLFTPSATLGLLPGVLRRSLLDSGKAREEQLTLDDLKNGFLLGNAVRGLMKAELI
ncbi:aminodeoxychorismate synthase component I [Altererythrobacter sp.]|uniref:aminodeoxychorismate synthase component I n=1 Tax=Altererythrobacter sp. TaxID=1872480 RepID=UPI001B0C5781|nr:aminodeoxychorismate synthase component I [Altererythrobacter sp.]MBO6610435.1 aminodeoxychorismate synthase component I [Altererythrobacter sp.]MBO6642438.1 aminodeoxychorismate synthase component I [Altererythrobacter sp.]MBO6709054.1 aminodeoxychorismate synthase component I [Altererythrobacter sp.]